MSLILLFVLTIFSCRKSQDISYETVTFNEQITDTITPHEDEVYGAKFIFVKGFVNDSIYVSFGGNSFKHFLCKEIDTSFSADYYGEGKAVFLFNPYKAKKGKLKITFSVEGK